MARTELTAQKIVVSGLAATTTTPNTDGVAFRNNGKVALMVTNGSASSITVTPVIAKQVEGISVTSPARTVAAGATKYFGPFSDAYDQLDGTQTVHVNLSAVTDVGVALLSLP